MEGGDQLGFEITELRLGLPGAVDGTSFAKKNEKKRVFSDFTVERLGLEAYDDGRRAPVAKSQVVGWPPVCLYRKKNSLADRDRAEGSKNTCVKVSIDGAIYLRKIDLSVQKGYLELVLALEKLFGCHGIGGDGLKDVEERGEYKLIYEDKDGDWMLVGDVPWEMFMESCRRLRVMKRSEAKDLGLSSTESNFLKGAPLKD